MKKYILNILTFGLYNRVDLMSQALIDAVAKQNLRNQQLQDSIDNIEQPDIDDAVDTYLRNNFCPGDWGLVDEDDIDYKIEQAIDKGDIDYKIEQAIDDLREDLESKIDELESDKE